MIVPEALLALIQAGRLAPELIKYERAERAMQGYLELGMFDRAREEKERMQALFDEKVVRAKAYQKPKGINK